MGFDHPSYSHDEAILQDHQAKVDSRPDGEAMRDCGFTSLVLETLPEAVLAPLLDAISLCQPHPPSQWSHELLELVNRSDISLILSSEKRPRLATSSILVRTLFVSMGTILKLRIGPDARRFLGLSASLPERGGDE